MLISMLITALISSAGESSVAAVNLVSPIFTLIVCLMNGISAGGTVEIAQSYGSRDMERMNLAAGHILWMTFLSGTALSLVLMVLVFVCTGIMNRFGGDEAEGGVVV